MTKSLENFNPTLRFILTKTGWVIKFGPNSVTCFDFALLVPLTCWAFALFRLLVSALQVQCWVLSKYSQCLSNAPALPTWECSAQNTSQPFISKKKQKHLALPMLRTSNLSSKDLKTRSSKDIVGEYPRHCPEWWYWIPEATDCHKSIKSCECVLTTGEN